MKIMEDNGPKVKNGPQKWHIDIEWHLYCISYRFVSDPNGSINRIYSFPPHLLPSKGATSSPDPTKRGAGRGSPFKRFSLRQPVVPGGAETGYDGLVNSRAISCRRGWPEARRILVGFRLNRCQGRIEDVSPNRTDKSASIFMIFAIFSRFMFIP